MPAKSRATQVSPMGCQRPRRRYAIDQRRAAPLSRPRRSSSSIMRRISVSTSGPPGHGSRCAPARYEKGGAIGRDMDDDEQALCNDVAMLERAIESALAMRASGLIGPVKEAALRAEIASLQDTLGTLNRRRREIVRPLEPLRC